MKSLKEDNSGFSLLELLISIVILGIVVIPIMNNFSAAGNLNMKSKRIQRATTIGQNTMEGVKKLNMEDTIKQFTDPTVSFDILDTSYSSIAEKYEANSSFNKITDPTGRTPGKNFFVMKGVKNGASTYDVRLSFDGTIYKNAATPSYNDYKLPEIVDLNGETTALIDPVSTGNIAGNPSADEAAFKLSSRNIVAVNSNPTAGYEVYPLDRIKNNLDMDIEVNIRNNGTKKVVECNTIYTLDTSSMPKFGSTNLSVACNVYSKEFKEKVENIYIMYHPFRLSTDKIYINCPSTGLSNETNLYIAKQAGTMVPSEVKLSKKNDTSDRLSIYSNMDSTVLKPASGSEIFTLKNELVAREAESISLYKVLVEVYESGSNFTNKYASFESTREED